MSDAEYDFDLICVGSGPAGQRAAIQAAKLGKRVAVVEKQRCIGGVCVETGTIPSKTFREAVRHFYSSGDFTPSGQSSRNGRPTIEALISHVSRVIEREVHMLEDALERNDIKMVHGKATFLDPHTIEIESLEGRRTLSAEYLLIAVGTRPSDPPGVVADGRTVVTSDSILQMDKLPRSLAVVGAGVVGIEYASMFASLDVDVTVVDQRTRPLEFLDTEIVDEMIHQMRMSGVTFRLSDAVSRIDVVESQRPMALITLESGKHVAADVILFTAGRVGATESLELQTVGIEPDNRGRLSVNKEFQTAVPNVYAAGDVIGFPALAATSSEQGRLAACSMFGVEAEPMAAHFPVGIYAIPEISMVGATEQELTEQKIPYESGIARYKEISRGQIMGDDSGMFKMLFHSETRKLLGCHCIGSGATELIHVGQAVLGLGGGLDYFLNTVFNYPTLAECYKVAAYNAVNKLILAQSVQGGTPILEIKSEKKARKRRPKN